MTVLKYPESMLTATNYSHLLLRSCQPLRTAMWYFALTAIPDAQLAEAPVEPVFAKTEPGHTKREKRGTHGQIAGPNQERPTRARLPGSRNTVLSPSAP